jgi:hypothetical protein
MSSIVSILHSLDFICPHCEEYNEITDIEVSVIIHGTDSGRRKDECVFIHECENCKGKFKITPHMDINVEKIK